LVEEAGGPSTPGIGFALSIERLLAAIDAENIALPIEKGLDCYIVALGDRAKERSVSLLQEMRKAGISADKDYENKKMKAQLKQADRLQAKFVIIIGDEELEKGVANVKNMATGEQDAVAFERLAEYIKERK